MLSYSRNINEKDYNSRIKNDIKKSSGKRNYVTGKCHDMVKCGQTLIRYR